MSQEQQTVVVTGGTRGVGAGIARSFLAEGARVVVCARRPPDEPVQVAGTEAEFRQLDVRDPEAAARLFEDVVAEYGSLDALVNNAGGAPFGLTADQTPQRMHRIVELNLMAPFYASVAAHAVMRGQPGGGSITMIGSVSGTRPSPGSAAYGAAKAGLENLARSLAVEWAPAVRVNTVVLGLARTESAHVHYGDADGVAAVARTVPLGRLAEPEDVGAACVYLASPRAAYVTGASLQLHGGGELPAFLAAATVNQDALKGS